MRVTFIGTGEAYTDTRVNTSILLQGSGSLLLDCGHLVPPAFSHRFPDPNFLDSVFVSHWHCDHIVGLVPLCMRWRQEGRTKPLQVIGPVGLEAKFRELFELLYVGFYNRSTFPITFIEAAPGRTIETVGFRLTFANGQHLTDELAVPTLAVRAEHGVNAVCYSGDTTYQPAIAELARGCNLLMHEANQPIGSIYNSLQAHCSPRDAGRCANNAGVEMLALVHVHRKMADRESELSAEAAAEFKGRIMIPIDGDVIEL